MTRPQPSPVVQSYSLEAALLPLEVFVRKQWAANSSVSGRILDPRQVVAFAFEVVYEDMTDSFHTTVSSPMAAERTRNHLVRQNPISSASK